MEFQDRVSAYPNRYLLTDENGNTSYVHLERADEPTVPGTPLNAETFGAMADYIKSASLPLSGGTMTGPLTLSWQNLKGFRALNGVALGGFRIDTYDYADIPIYGNKWSILVCVTSPGGYTALYYLSGEGKAIKRTHKICGDDGYGIQFGISATDGYVSIYCGTDWSTGWYITSSVFEDLRPNS